MANPVRIARVEKDLTQGQLADKAGVDLSTITRAEKGQRLSPLSMGRIARALELPVERIFPELEEVAS